MNLKDQGPVVWLFWVVLAALVVGSLLLQRWSLAFVALATLVASFLPVLVANRMRIRLPLPFLAFTFFFIFATLFLGEALNFYNKYWWWDVALHGLSAVGFGLVGFLLIFSLFEGDRYAAPAWAVSFFSWCFAVSIGAAWEIFEFAMDQTFGLNMQKSGLVDTMWDLIVDVIGAALGALSGFAYLKGAEKGGLLSWLIAQFVNENRRYFRRLRR